MNFKHQTYLFFKFPTCTLTTEGFSTVYSTDLSTQLKNTSLASLISSPTPISHLYLSFPGMTSRIPYYPPHVIPRSLTFASMCLHVFSCGYVSHYLFLVSYQRTLKHRVVPFYVFMPDSYVLPSLIMFYQDIFVF